MENMAVSTAKSSSKDKDFSGSFLSSYILNPIKSGLFGFSAFFSILLITKMISYWIGTYEKFVVDLDDVLLSVIGFVLVFLIKFLENFKQEET